MDYIRLPQNPPCRDDDDPSYADDHPPMNHTVHGLMQYKIIILRRKVILFTSALLAVGLLGMLLYQIKYTTTTITVGESKAVNTQVSLPPVQGERMPSNAPPAERMLSNATWLPSTGSTEFTTSLPPHNYLLTVVTALMDSGRGNWSHFTRSLDKYLEYMRNVLQLRVPMVVVVDRNSSAEFVHKERARIGWTQWTKVRQMSLQELPLVTFLPRIKQIMRDEQAHWRPEWDQAIRATPEASHPEYVVVTNSKPWFVAEAVEQNPFNTDNFAWLDAGYGHGNRAIYPANWQWRPKLTRGKISIIKLIHTDPMAKYDIKRLYRKNGSDVINGGVFAGNSTAMQLFCTSWLRMFKELMDKGMVDDDQFYEALLINQHPDWFNLIEGGWFDAFKLIV